MATPEATFAMRHRMVMRGLKKKLTQVCVEHLAEDMSRLTGKEVSSPVYGIMLAMCYEHIRNIPEDPSDNLVELAVNLCA